VLSDSLSFADTEIDETIDYIEDVNRIADDWTDEHNVTSHAPLTMSDPWNWTVDQVVYNLCVSDDLWADRRNSRRPNAVLLEQKLQEHGIDGATLIEHVDMDVLRGDLGIKAFGEASSIKYAIEKLRNMSPRYVQQQVQSLCRQDSVSRTASEIHRPQWSFKSPFSTAVSAITFSPKRLPSPTPIPALEPPEAHETIDNRASHEVAEPPRKKRRVQLITLPARGDKDTFLGRKIILDDLFFRKAEHPHDDDSDDSGADEFTLTRDSQSASAGRDIFISNRMQHYLRTSPQSLAPGKTILPPYPARLSTTHNAHALLFSVEDGRARVAMCNPANPSQAVEHTHDNNNEWSFLLKWNNKQSEILPAYGESGSENGFGGSLLSEFEEEEAEREAAKSNSQQLSPHEVATIINAYIEERERIWTQDSLPRWQGKAWSIWKKSRGRRRAQAVATVKHEIDRIQNRLQKLRQCIMEEVWSRSKTALLKAQCPSLLVTIEDLMELNFQLEVLQRAQAPEQPEVRLVSRIREKPDHQHDLDEESLYSESTTNFIEGDEDRLSLRTTPTLTQSSPRPQPNLESTARPHLLVSASKPNAEDFVDLTGSSPIREVTPSSHAPSSSYHGSSSPIRTPRRRRPLSGHGSSSPREASFIDWDARPEDATEGQIRCWSYEELEDQSDRKRLLLKLRQNLGAETRKAIDLRFDQLDEGKMHTHVKRAILALRKDEHIVKPFKAEASRIVLTIARLWICWNSCDHRYMSNKPSLDVLTNASEFDNFEGFFAFCHSLLPASVISDDDVDQPGEATAPSSRPHKGDRKTTSGIGRDKGIRRLQEAGQARMIASEQAKSQLESSGFLETAERIIINPDKADDQEYIFVNKHIASRIKAHQVEGIQFIWRELVTAGQGEMQGCLLAHTMGVSTSPTTASSNPRLTIQ